MMDKKVRKTAAILGIIAFLFFSFAFTMVPLYNTFCRTTGYNGKVDLKAAKHTNATIPINRKITMQFVTMNNNDLPWDFYAKASYMEISPEQNYKMIFSVKNRTEKTMTVQAIPSVTPWQAAKHLHKIQCFCFSKQSLQSGEAKDMPLIFWIDKDLPKDIKTITLAYTLFDVG